MQPIRQNQYLSFGYHFTLFFQAVVVECSTANIEQLGNRRRTFALVQQFTGVLKLIVRKQRSPPQFGKNAKPREAAFSPAWVRSTIKDLSNSAKAASM